MIILIDLAGLDGGGHRLHALLQIGAVAVLQAVGEFTAAIGHGANADKARHFLVRLLEVTVDAAHGGVGDIDLADLPLAHRQRSGGSGAQRQVGAVGQRAQLFAEDLVKGMDRTRSFVNRVDANNADHDQQHGHQAQQGDQPSLHRNLF